MALPTTDPAPPHRQALLPGAVARGAIVDPGRRVGAATHGNNSIGPVVVVRRLAYCTLPLVLRSLQSPVDMNASP